VSRFVEVGGARLECLDLPGATPEILLLHEGLGSVSMWRDFPEALARETGRRTIAYSRRGFGRSSPRNGPYGLRFMHDEALGLLPELRERLSIVRPVLVGHSTGASMGLIHAGADRWPVAGVVAMAPLTTVERSNVESIEKARRLYETSDWRERLARHHDDVDGVFYGWNDTWLDPGFRSWNILEDLAGIRCPVLAIQGEDDPYSTTGQVEAIRAHARRSAGVEVLRIPGCGHAPHRERPEEVIPAIARFVHAAV
jgi:pimeloyl-ACP methyl ester carboxylesterase